MDNDQIMKPTNTLRKSNVPYGSILVAYVNYFLLTLMLHNLNYVTNSNVAMTLAQLT